MFLAGATMQGLLVVNKPEYVPEPYQGYLFAVMIVTVGVLTNTFAARWLPRLEGIIFIVFVLAFLAFMIVLWVLPPRLSAGE